MKSGQATRREYVLSEKNESLNDLGLAAKISSNLKKITFKNFQEARNTFLNNEATPVLKTSITC